MSFNKHPLAHGVYAAIALWPFYFTPFLLHACLVVSTFYYSRELVDAQRVAGIDRHERPFSLIFPWQWHKASQWDYYSAAAVCLFFGVVEVAK